MVEQNKRKRSSKNGEETVGSGLGVVPGDTIASALDPFGTAAEANSREDLGNKPQKDATSENKASRNSL